MQTQKNGQKKERREKELWRTWTLHLRLNMSTPNHYTTEAHWLHNLGEKSLVECLLDETFASKMIKLH